MTSFRWRLHSHSSASDFGRWEEKNRKTNEKASRFGVVGTVFVAFFIGEFGDKTQLATISLAAQYQNAVSVLIGATLGMLVADGAGIAVGVVLGRHIPERVLKWVSAAIFIVFGLAGFYEVLEPKLGTAYTTLTLVALAVACISAARFITRKQKWPIKNTYAEKNFKNERTGWKK